MHAAAATHAIAWRPSTTPSGSTVWRTPDALYLALDKEFAFTIDIAADAERAKHVRYVDREVDALASSWAGERVFCNPPYGRELDRWVAKAFDEAQAGALVVMVLPARTGNAWFHRWCLPHAEIRFIRGRLGFSQSAVAAGVRARAPFDSMVVIFHPHRLGAGRFAAQSTFPGFARG